MPPSWRVLHGVVDQVGQQLAQQPFVAHHLHRLRVQAQVDVARRWRRPGGFQRCLRTAPSGPRAACGCACMRARVGARQRQQLVGQLRGAARGAAQAIDLVGRQAQRAFAPGRTLAACAQASTCACRPASGVRSWCAASATKRRWLSACALTSPNRRLSDSTSGRTSSGEAPSSMRAQVARRAALHRLLQRQQRLERLPHRPAHREGGGGNQHEVGQQHAAARWSAPIAGADRSRRPATTTTSPSTRLLALAHDAPGGAVVLLAVHFGLVVRRRQAGQPGLAQQHLAVDVEDGVGGASRAAPSGTPPPAAPAAARRVARRCCRSPSRPASGTRASRRWSCCAATLSAER